VEQQIALLVCQGPPRVVHVRGHHGVGATQGLLVRVTAHALDRPELLLVPTEQALASQVFERGVGPDKLVRGPNAANLPATCCLTAAAIGPVSVPPAVRQLGQQREHTPAKRLTCSGSTPKQPAISYQYVS